MKKTFAPNQTVEIQAKAGYPVKWEPATYDRPVVDMRGWHQVSLLRSRYVNAMSGLDVDRDDPQAYATKMLLVPSQRIRSIEEKITLTKEQHEELQWLAEEPRSTHNTAWRNGRKKRSRAKVQNSLQKLGLAHFCELDGTSPPISLVIVMSSYGNPRPQCRITDKGLALLNKLKKEQK